MNLKTLFLELFLLLDIKLLYVVFNPINSPLVAPIPCKNKETAGGAKMLHTIGGNRVKNLPRAILSYFIWVADFFLVPGRDKYTMWDRRPLGQILFDPNRLYDVLYVH